MAEYLFLLMLDPKRAGAGMQALLFQTHILNQSVLARYKSIQLPSGFDRYLLLDAQNTRKSPRKKLKDVILFSLDKLKTIGYLPIAASLVPGSNHFPVLEFFRSFPRYEYVWTMEYDVSFSGSWTTFFHAINSQADLLTAKIREYWDDPDWYWWKTISHSSKSRSNSNPRVRWPVHALASFNPLYRLSSRAARHLRNEYLKQGWIGHHELTMPTLLNMAEMIIEDFGTPPEGCGVKGKWYSEKTYNHVPIDFPSLARSYINTLFHPVKTA